MGYLSQYPSSPPPFNSFLHRSANGGPSESLSRGNSFNNQWSEAESTHVKPKRTSPLDFSQ